MSTSWPTTCVQSGKGIDRSHSILQLTLQVRAVAKATTAVARGDLTQKVTDVKVSGELLELVNTINSMIDQLAIFAAEVKKVAREVGTEGKLGGQAEVGNVEGIWQEITYVPSSCSGAIFGGLTSGVSGCPSIPWRAT